MAAEVAFASKGIDGRRVIAAHSLLLCVVAHALADMGVAASAPNVERQLEATDQDALVQLAGSVTQRMLAVV